MRSPIKAWALPLTLILAAATARAEDAKLIAPDARLEKVVGDLGFSEGPAWRRDGVLLFEDIPANRILMLDRKGRVSVFREPSGRSNGLVFDRQGRLLAAEGNSKEGGRRVSRTEKDGKVVTLADTYEGKRLNSPNDLTVDKKGRIYFTDPRYGDRAGVEQDKEAVYRIDPDGQVVRLIDDLSRPNGIALSPNERTLYVADNHPESARALWAYDLSVRGEVSRGRVIHQFGPGERGIDGMAIDTAGRVWATAGKGPKAGVYVFAPDGKLLTVVPTPEDPTNCTFGDRDRRTLYITTTKSLFRIRTRAQGKPSPPGK
jgi:gluconolactonase